MLTSLINRPCTIIRGVEDPDDPYETPDEPDELETVCELQEQRSGEPGDAGELSSSELVAYFRPGVELTTADTLEVDGKHYEFTGDPFTWRNPLTGRNEYIRANVKRAG